MSIKKILIAVFTVSLLVISVAAVSAQGPQEGRGQRGEHRAEMQALVQEYTGLTHDEIREAFQNGSTLADLIEANGQSVDDFITASVELAEARLDEAVENGFLTEDEAAEKLTEITEKITARLNGEFERGNGPRGGQGRFGGQGNDTAAPEADA